MQTSGLVLDVYDDFRGEVLRTIFSSREHVPELVKQAHVLSADERHRLPDDAYALVMLNDGQKLRKFACIDAGNTALSVQYFQKNAHKLPLNAQLVAATNLATACEWYGLEELAKQAGLIGWAAKKGVEHAVSHPIDTAMRLQTGSAVVQGARQGIGERMGAIRQMEGSGQVVTPAQVSGALGKHAELTGTPVMPLQSPSNKAIEPTKAVVNKTAGMGHLVPGHHGVEPTKPPLDDDTATAGVQMKRPPQVKALHPHVDVTNHTPPKTVKEKYANDYALDGQYPLDSYDHVQRAVGYFDEYFQHFTPSERREYAVNVEKRASALNLPIGPMLRKYASKTFAPTEEIKSAFAIRRGLIMDEKLIDALDLLETCALHQTDETKTAGSNTPETVCAVLCQIDKQAGLDFHYDKDVLDPYLSVYGYEKTAADDWSYIDGNLYVTEADLMKISKTQNNAIRKTFGEDFSVEFRKDPVGIFKSLPKDQKRVVANFASDNSPGTNLSC